MAYVKTTWQNSPSTNTPINATNLNHIEQGIYDAAATADQAEAGVESLDPRMDLVEQRLDNLIPEGTPTQGNAELIDIRVGANGITYPDAGSAVRGQYTEINSALSDVNEHFVYPVNRLNPNTFTEPGYVIDLTDGSVVAYGTELCVSDFIPIEAGVTYTSTMRTSYYGANTKFPVYDENKTFVKSITPDSVDTTNNIATFTSDIHGYTRVVVYKTRITDTMFVVGNAYPDEFVPYSDKIYLADDIYINAQNVDGLDNALSDTGVFDTTQASDIMTLTAENDYISISGTSVEGAYHATIANVKTGDKYTLKCQTGSAVRAYVIVGTGGNVIRYADADTWTTNHDFDVTVTIQSNEDGATLYINTVISSYLGAYHEYSTSVLDGDKNYGHGYLFGKMIALDGDSICKGEGYNGGYGKIIAERYSMQYQNLGVSGATITAGTQSSGVNRHWICRDIQNLSSNADYVIVEGGVNDSADNVPMGTITSGYNDTLDDTTFCGAMESICKQLVYDFHGKKVGYIAVHQMTDKYRNTNTDENTSYYYQALKICKKWGVPVCDLNITVPPFAYLDNTIKTAYTKDGDGWHPNEQGYKKYYCDKIVAWMKTL